MTGEPARLEGCRAADITRLVFLAAGLHADDADTTMRRLDDIAPYIAT